MRYSGLPKIEGMDFDKLLPSSVPGMNDTACHDGTSTETMPCGDNPCLTADLQVDISASVPIGEGNSISYGMVLTMVMRMCGTAGATGCSPLTMDTRMGPPQGPNNEQQTIRDLLAQMAQNMNQSVTPALSGQQCMCDSDGCNSAKSTMSLVDVAPTTTAAATTGSPDTATKGDKNGGASPHSAIYCFVLMVLIAAFSM
ncbi:uncharacterized protein LOC106155101 isoform X2 [Lingula anatina]|nr:uncharacterized protein LOC106155101 isoform X2 [Lingula anatina]|eukprot:XP_013385218.1 uncharacterized protein LOC106155101 isoform X2 [Lingula anatina]